MSFGRFPGIRLTAAGLCCAILLMGIVLRGQSRPAGPVTPITYLTPVWTSFLSAPDSAVADAVTTLRTRIGEGGALKLGFSAYVRVTMGDWNVDLSSPAAIKAELGDFESQIDEGIRRARSQNIVFVVNLMTAGRDLVDPAQRTSCDEDRRVMQWLSDNAALDGWWTHSRYARRQYRLQQAYMREAAKILASRVAQYPESLVAIAGDGEVELGTGYLPRLADYSPFAIAEFRDWLRGEGLYAPGAPFDGEAYAGASRFRGDATPDTDTNGDGHTLNGDFGTSFTSWSLRYFDWSLSDPDTRDPKAIAISAYAAPGFVAMPDAGAWRFDAPRVPDSANAWWSIWGLFRQMLVWHHNRDLAKWITTTPDAQGRYVPTNRFFSYQIPADYLFGGTPENSNDRLIASASPWWTANISPFGGLGFTSFGVRFGTNSYVRTLPGFTGAIKACGPGAPDPPACVDAAAGLAGTRWGIFEWNPVLPIRSSDSANRVLRRDVLRKRQADPSTFPFTSSPDSPGSPGSSPGSPGSGGATLGPMPTDTAIYRDEIERLRKYRPAVLAPFAWEIPSYKILDTGFEPALRQLAAYLKDGWSPSLRVDRTSVILTAVRQRGAVVAQTPAQSVLVSQPTGGTVDWTASATRPWVALSQASGHGDGRFLVAIDPSQVSSLPSGTYPATVVVSAPGSIEGQRTIDVTVNLIDAAMAQAPFGSFDTPLDGETGLQGSFAVTGWALDDTGVDRVEIWRDLVAGELASNAYWTDPQHPAFGKVFVANPVFVAGSRTDVEAAYPNVPVANRAGWGYLLLSWGLPHQGNGSYTLYAYAFDVDGHSSLLGSKTVGVDNAHATRPFGAIDTPSYGGTASGAQFVNFGWALTPNATPPCTILDDVQVMIDAAPWGAVTYGQARTDVAALFPGFSNGSDMGGNSALDTTALANGVHQISWVVTDSCGRRDGIGSRYFWVLNEGGGAAGVARPAGTLSPAPSGTADAGFPVAVRQLGGEWQDVYPNRDGTRVIEIGQNGLIEARLPQSADTQYTGVQLTAGKRIALPPGSSLDAAAGIFRWQPAPGFLGAYDLLFESPGRTNPEVRTRVVVGPPMRMAIDMPANEAAVFTPFTISGWAVDLASAGGSGVDTVHVWAYPLSGGKPIWLGVALHGDIRPDVSALYGSSFSKSGFSLAVDQLRPGSYDIVTYAHRTSTSTFEAAQVARIIVRQ